MANTELRVLDNSGVAERVDPLQGTDLHIPIEMSTSRVFVTLAMLKCSRWMAARCTVKVNFCF